MSRLLGLNLRSTEQSPNPFSRLALLGYSRVRVIWASGTASLPGVSTTLSHLKRSTGRMTNDLAIKLAS